jgi:hypothetical protein
MQRLQGDANMKLDAGNVVWIRCEVKPGPFPDERRVRLTSSLGEWIGFVPVSYLREPILEGETKIQVLVVTVQEDRFSAKVPGQGISGSLFGELISKAHVLDTVPT